MIRTIPLEGEPEPLTPDEQLDRAIERAQANRLTDEQLFARPYVARLREELEREERREAS